MADPHKRLMSALIQRGGDGARILHESSRSWASATFTGARHCLTMAVPDVKQFAEGLGEVDFTIPGHIVADIVVTTAREGEADVEALTIEVA